MWYKKLLNTVCIFVKDIFDQIVDVLRQKWLPLSLPVILVQQWHLKCFSGMGELAYGSVLNNLFPIIPNGYKTYDNISETCCSELVPTAWLSVF